MNELVLPSKKWLKWYTLAEWIEAAGIDPESEHANAIRRAVRDRSTLGELFTSMYLAHLRAMLKLPPPWKIM